MPDTPTTPPSNDQPAKDEPVFAAGARGIKRSGHIALVGRPNVGKSTLLNALLGQKISIVTPKPQTTRQRALGIKQVGDSELIFVDTPGIHKQQKHALNRHMNRAATSILNDVDLVLWLIEGEKWTSEDENVLSELERCNVPVGLAINKVDLVRDKQQLLPVLQRHATRRPFAFVIPISAHKGSNLDELETEMIKMLPGSEAMYPEDQVTDISSRFLAAELIREKLLNVLAFVTKPTFLSVKREVVSK